MAVPSPLGSRSGAFLVAALALAAFAACPGCKEKKKVVKKPQVEQKAPSWTSEWGSVRSLGMEGKWNCEQGLKACQETASTGDRKPAYDQMVKGYRQIQDAVNKADALLEAAQTQEPGKDFTGYGDEVAGWQELLKPVKAMLPEEYSSKLHE